MPATAGRCTSSKGRPTIPPSNSRRRSCRCSGRCSRRRAAGRWRHDRRRRATCRRGPIGGDVRGGAGAAPGDRRAHRRDRGGRRIPPDMVAQLKAAGCFRSLVPRSHGGDEHDLAAHMRVLEELARTDGSVAWTVMIGAAAPVMLGMLRDADVRRDLRGGSRCRGRRDLQPHRIGGADRRWVHGHRAVDVRQRLPTRRLVPRPLHRRRRPHAADADDGGARLRRRRSSTRGACRGCAARGATTSRSTDVFVPDERTFQHR